MTNSRWLHPLAISASLLAPACVAGSDASDPTAADQADQAASPTIIRMMPIHNSTAATAESAKPTTSDATAATPHLTYWGGPVLKNVRVVSAWWNSSSPFASNFAQFYPSVVASPLYTMLNQYSAIGFGSAATQVLFSQATGSITDSGIQSFLRTNIGNGRLPLPTANTYYPIHFPPGETITAPDGSRNCVQFCAYHGTFVLNGVNVNYGVIPYVGDSGCAGGCGGNTTLNNEFSVASHELVEATTDPAVGLATVIGSPLAWYDPNNGEIGDICNGIQGTTNGFVVQKEWSNAVNACVDH